MTYSYTGDRLFLTPRPGANIQPYDYSVLDNGAGSKSVGQPSLFYERMLPYWAVIEAVKGGTFKLREMGETYLPKEPQEQSDSYSRRLNRSTCAPFYTRLVRGLIGMVLRKPIRITYGESEGEAESEQLKQAIAPHLEDINLQGDNLQTFAKDVFESAINYNYAGILVEYPNTQGVQTLAEERAAGFRPYWVLYNATEILGARWQQVGSRRSLINLRLKQTVTEYDEFQEVEVEQILVYDLVGVGEEGDRLTRCRWRIYREGDKEWVLHDEGLLSLSEIPFVFVYTDKKQRLELEPPMLEVAYLNLKHYQLSADLDHALHVSNVPRCFIFGISAEELGDIGAIDEAVCIPNENARVEWKAASVDNLDQTQKRITEVEGQMSFLGLSTLVSQKNVGESAEAKRLDRTQGDSIMAVVAQSLQNAIDGALKYHAAYLAIATPPKSQVNRDFDLSQLTPQMIQALYQVRQGGDLSQETFLQLLHQGEIGLADDWNPEEEILRIKQEFAEQAKTVAIDPINVEEY